MTKIIRYYLLLGLLMAFCMPLFAQKTQPVVDKETIKKVQQELKAQMPDAKIKTIKYDDGGVYIGECNKKIKHGLGTMFFPSGDVYIGQWESDAISGQGSMTYANGDKYDGEWLNGKCFGEGSKKFSTKMKIKELRGKWIDGTFASGLFIVDDNMQINGEADGDMFIGEAEMLFKTGYSFRGKVVVPGNSTLKKSVLTALRFNGQGCLTRGPNYILEGNWENSYLTSGNVLIKDDDYVLSGEVHDDVFRGTFTKGKETYSGVFSNKEANRALSSFSGVYSLRSKDVSYSYNGRLKYNKPIEGELTQGNVKTGIHIDYDSKGNAMVTLDDRGRFTIPYINNEDLFEKIEHLGEEEIASNFKHLDGKVFSIRQKNTPLSRVDRIYEFAFFRDGIMSFKMWHVEGQVEIKHQNKTTKNQTISCPTCHGAGIITEDGFDNSGRSYSRKITCPMCGGKGKTDSEIANIIQDGLNDFWAAVGTMEVINGYTARDFLDISVNKYCPYTITGGDIHVDLEDGYFDDFIISNGNLVSKLDKTFILKPRSDSRSRYADLVNTFTSNYNNAPDYYVDVDPIRNPFLPFVILHPAPFKSYRFMYKANTSIPFQCENKTVRNSFYNGFGTIDLNNTVNTVCLGNIGFIGPGLNMQGQQPETIQIPNTVRLIALGDNLTVKNIILTSVRPPLINISYASKNSHPEKRIVFYVPANLIDTYKKDDDWKLFTVKPISDISLSNGMILNAPLKDPNIELIQND